MGDGFGNLVGGLVGLAIVSSVLNKNNGRTRTVTRTIYKNGPKKKSTVTVVKRTTRPKSFFGI